MMGKSTAVNSHASKGATAGTTTAAAIKKRMAVTALPSPLLGLRVLVMLLARSAGRGRLI